MQPAPTPPHKRKRATLTLAQKGEIIQLLSARTHTQAAIANLYHCSRTAIATIACSKHMQQSITDKLQSLPASQLQHTARVQAGQFIELENTLHEWCTRARARNISLSQDILAAKAQQFAALIVTRLQSLPSGSGNPGYVVLLSAFKASGGCVQRFQKRKGMQSTVTHGDAASTDPGQCTHTRAT